jgi:UDP-4-amino-4,6-dideoxy-N-acetyl-beta-L-altrosamine N-acetyltransferase
MVVKLLDFRNSPPDLLLEVRNWRNHQDTSKYFIIDEIDQKTHDNWLKTRIKDGLDQAFLIMNDDIAEGCIYLRNIDSKHKTAELGVFLRPQAPKDKKLGSIALYNILNHGFTNLGLEKIYLQVFDFNDKAFFLYKKFYFQIEGKLKEHVIKSGNRIDVNIMSLLKVDWNNNKANLRIYNE